jgi:hypothetical protein
MRGRQARQLPGAQRLITIFLMPVNSSLCGIYIFVILQVTGGKLMPRSFPWTVDLLAVSNILQNH